MNAANSIKMRLFCLGKKQTDLYDELNNRGISIGNFQQLNAFINGRRRGERANFVLSNVYRIIADWEAALKAQPIKEKPSAPIIPISPDENRLESRE